MDPGKFLLLPPPPTEYGSRKISATTPPPTESIRAKLGLSPQMEVGPYAYGLKGIMYTYVGPIDPTILFFIEPYLILSIQCVQHPYA